MTELDAANTIYRDNNCRGVPCAECPFHIDNSRCRLKDPKLNGDGTAPCVGLRLATRKWLGEWIQSQNNPFINKAQETAVRLLTASDVLAAGMVIPTEMIHGISERYMFWSTNAMPQNSDIEPRSAIRKRLLGL